MDARDEVKSRLNIEDVIGRYLDLKKSGRNFKALSPFTKEKTASFVVSPEKQIWHDFSSGKGGDIFTFVMEVEGVDFRGALEILARRAGVDLEQFENPNKSSVSKNSLYDIYEIATKFYQVQFSANSTARDYVFKKRRFSKDTALTWQLGYSPNTGDALYVYLKNKGYSDKEILAAGLVTSRYNKYVDMFRGRLMIPLADGQGRVIGYTARALSEEDKGPKYINTPQTVLYDKSRHVFGLHLAKESIRSVGYAVIVEGNLDVLASHQVGIKQVVATAGTALTEQHLKTIGLLTKDIRLCFDADKAGLSATERSIPLASKQNLNVSVIPLPSGKDPDELMKTNKELWIQIIDEPVYAVDWLIDHYKSQLDLSSAPGKRRFTDLLLPTIQSLSDAVERDHYINELSRLLEVNPSALNSKLSSFKDPDKKLKLPIKTQTIAVDKDAVERQRLQDNLLSLMLVREELRGNLHVLTEDMLVNGNGTQLFNILIKHPDLNAKKDIARFKELTDYVKIELLLYEELYSSLDDVELAYEAARLKARLAEIYIKNQKAIITNELKITDSKDTRKLLQKAKELDNLLSKVNEEGSMNAQESS